MYSDDSSDDEFFDPEEDIRSETAPPSPSWLTRQQSIGAVSTRGDEVGGAGEAHAEDPSASTSPSAASGGALDLSQLAETMPSVTGDEGPPPESDTLVPRAPSPKSLVQPSSLSSAGPPPELDVDSRASPAAEREPTGTTPTDDDAPPASPSPTDGGPTTPKPFEIEKVFRIKDLDTGQEFLVDEAAADRMLNANAHTSPTNSPGAGVKPARAPTSTVKDLQTGRDISVEDFERSVGLSPLMREVNARERAAVGASVDNDGVGVGVGNNGTGTSTSTHDDARAQKKKKPFGRNPGRWLTKRLGEAQSYVNKSSASKAPRDSGGAGPGHEGVGAQVKVLVNRKVYKEFTETRLIQTIGAHEDAVWTMKFSHTGEYLATAGQDAIVRVWQLDRDDGAVHIFKPTPFREYSGHKGDVLDLCWSHTDWLLSSSMDKTVRLWYMTMDECLRIFSHQDFVTAIAFNPVNDKYFLSGSLDGKLRFWSIPDHRVADWVDIGEMVTAASFNSDGSTAVAGSYKGKCHFYRMDGVRFDYITHLDVRNTKSNKASGKKITGLSWMPGDDDKLLVTSNDSRIRVYDGYTLACKYKGHKNNNSQIRASFSPGAEFIVCGSEDEHVYVWSTVNSFVPSINPIYTGYRRDKHSSYEQFAAQHDIATVALFAPDEVRRSRTGDAAAAVAAARAAAKEQLQPTKAAEALFAGNMTSPSFARVSASEGGTTHSRTSSKETNAKEIELAEVGGEEGDDVGGEEGEGGVEEGESATVTETPGEEGADTMSPREQARLEGERAFAAGMAIGQIIVTAGYSGEIRIFENLGPPQWI
jgi:WD40 repeat protein